MRYASLVERVAADAGDGGVDPWEVHYLAQARVAAGDDVTMLSIGQEVDHRTPPDVVAAAVTALEAGDHHYADISGLLSLREAIAEYHERLTGQRVGVDQLTVFAGAQNALFSCAQVLLEPGDEVVLVAPYYTTYPATFASSGATLVTVETQAADAHRLDPAAIAQAFTERTRALVLNVPGNPVARCPDAATLAEIVELCVKERVWLIFDSVYLDVVAAEGVELPHALPGADDVLITIGSVSKSHRMTGWRIGWAAGPARLAEHFGNLSLCMHYGLPPFIMQAARQALISTTNTPRIVQAALDQRRNIALEALGDIAPAVLLDSGRGMFILLDVAPLGVDGRGFALALLERYAVAVLPCIGFGPGGETLIRIGLCVDGPRLSSACRDVRRCVDDFVHKRVESCVVSTQST